MGVDLTGSRWDLYRALSEPVRLRLLALGAEEELSIGELAELTGESQPNVSRHVAALKQAGLLSLRKEGTRSFIRLMNGVSEDAVVADAIKSGHGLCEKDGSLKRLGDILEVRDRVARDYFADAGKKNSSAKGAPSEYRAYLSLVASLLPRRALAVDIGTGDGSLLDIVAPMFDHVIAVDRSEAQLAFAKERVRSRGYKNVELVCSELRGEKLRSKVGQGADVVFAVRVLHHAPSPQAVLNELAALVRPGGSVLVLDYAPHEDEAMREAADLWLGFEPGLLKKFTKAAGFESCDVTPIPSTFRGEGPDAHLPWQALIARKASSKNSK